MRRECRNVFSATYFKGSRQLAIPACITARAWRTCRDACRDILTEVAGKTFPAFAVHAQPHILRIWEVAHGMSISPLTYARHVEPMMTPENEFRPKVTLIKLRAIIRRKIYWIS